MRSFLLFAIIAATCATLSGCATARPRISVTLGSEPRVDLYFDTLYHAPQHTRSAPCN